MHHRKFADWMTRKIVPLKRNRAVAIIYLIFLMTSQRKHTLAAAARFANSSKARFSSFLKDHCEIAIYSLSELSKKQTREFSKIVAGLAQNRLPWTIAIIVDATFLTRSSLKTENAKKFNHGKG